MCEARVQPNGEYLNVTIARFPAELPMQVDLVNEGYEWYAFAFDRGEMMAFATFSDVWVTDPTTNFGESPVLQPLKQFGFNIYSSPGPGTTQQTQFMALATRAAVSVQIWTR